MGLKDFFFTPSVRERELRETRAAWEEVEALWRSSELGREGTRSIAPGVSLENVLLVHIVLDGKAGSPGRMAVEKAEL